MAMAYCPGPSLWFVRAGAGASWLYLGQCEGETQITLSPEYDDIMYDGGGPRVPLDRQFLGGTASVNGDLVFFNQSALNPLLNWINDPSATPGTWTNGTIGTLCRLENRAFGLCIVSQYGAKDVFANAGMAPAWTFPFVVPTPTSFGLSMRAKRVRVGFDCLPVLGGDGSGVLYTNSAEGLNLPNPS